MELIYLESDEEITSVIDKISKASSSEVALVIPRGGNIAQSIVNLKLLKKRSTDLGKDVSLVTSDKISRNLASQVGITVYSRVEEVGRRKAEPVMPVVAPVVANEPETIKSEVPAPEAKRPAEELPEIPGVKINRYYDERPKAELVKAEKEPPKTESVQKKIVEEPKVEDSEPIEDKTDQLGEVIELPPAEIPKSDFKNRQINDIEPRAFPDDEPKSDSKKHEAEPAEHLHHHIEADSSVRTPGHRMSAGRRFKPLKKRRALAILIASALVIILAFGYLILPQAKATITFKADNFEETSDVGLNKTLTAIDSENLISPANESVVEKEVTDTFQATGQKNIGNKATGKVTLNNAGSSSVVKINAGQGLSYDGKRYTINAAVSIPGASVSGGSIVPGQTSADVTAVDSGEAYNLSPVKLPNKFTLDGLPSTQTWAESSTAFTGGSTQNVKVVQASDISSAADKIKARLSSEAKDEVLKKIPSVDKYVDGTIDEQMSDLSASVAAGTQADTFTYKGKIKTTILSFNETILKDAIIAKYEKTLPDNRVMVQRDKVEFSYQVVARDMKAGSALYKVNYKGKISSKIDSAGLKEQLRGKSIDEARKVLSALELVKDVNISMTPNLSIYKTMPLLTRSINIETVYSAE